MTTMNERYGDGSNHIMCDKCGLCITCGDCVCNHGTNWPGNVAQEYKTPIGTIGCPHCGAVVTGAMSEPICKMCDKPYWDGWEKK